METRKITVGEGDALIITDVQNDLLPGGRLAVKVGDAVIPPLNGYIELFREKGLPIVASRDWHPPEHCSFTSRGGSWPPHCVAGTVGAEIAADLKLPADALIVDKATAPDHHTYSCFDGTGLDEALRARGVRRLFVGGLTTDYGVQATVMEALALGYRVCFLEDAIRAINRDRLDGIRAERRMYAKGAVPVTRPQLQ